MLRSPWKDVLLGFLVAAIIVAAPLLVSRYPGGTSRAAGLSDGDRLAAVQACLDKNVKAGKKVECITAAMAGWTPSSPPPPVTTTATVTTTETATVTPEPTTTSEPPVTTTSATPTTTTTAPPPADCAGQDVSAGASLSSVVSAAPADTTFCLGSGTFTIGSTVTLKDGDALQGAGQAKTFVVGNGSVQNLVQAASGATVEVRDLDVSGGVGNATCAPDCGRAFYASGDAWTFNRIHCHGNDNQCIGSGSADVTFLSSECDHNGNAAFASFTAVRSTACIKRVRGGSSNITTIVRDSYIHDNYWEGVWFDYYEGVMFVQDNVITGNGKAGIGFEVSGGFNARDEGTISGNVIQDNGLASYANVPGGIVCNTCAELLVTDNDFGGNHDTVVSFIKSTREWGNIHGVAITGNRLHGDTVACGTAGVTCSGNQA